MAGCLNRRTVEAFTDGIRHQMSQRLLGGRDVRPNGALDIQARIMAGVAFEVAGDVAKLKDQLFISTMCCDTLTIVADALNEALRPATKARGHVRITGTANAAIPADLEITIGSTGLNYVLDPTVSNPATLDAEGEATLLMRASLPGEASNALAGSEAATTSALSDIDNIVTVLSDGFAGGADEETCEEMRARLLDRRRNAITAGNRASYRKWVMEFPGVERVAFSGCQCDDCCGPVITIYPFFKKDIYKPHGVPPDSVALDVLEYVFGPNNGLGEAKAPTGAVGQILRAEPAELTVKVYTMAAVNPVLFETIEAVVAEFFDSITTVGGSFCTASIMQAVMAAVPSACVRGVAVCSPYASTEDDLVTLTCGRFPVLGSLSVEARKPPANPCG